MLKEGDVIECRDTDDCIDTMKELARVGIETEFMYEYKGAKGLWLEVTKIEKGAK